MRASQSKEAKMANEKMKIEFAPGCFDHFEGTQEELDELMATITQMIDDGSLFENSRPLSEEDLDDLPPELLESIFNDLEMINDIESVEQARKNKLN